MKRIISIQDLSCIGKCSQSIALPVLSAMGIECAAIPTAIFSTHTAFPSFASRDLTDFLPTVARQWRALGLGGDAIYTGYLGSEEQIALVMQIFEQFDGALRFVDPVMADNGRLYTGFSPDFPEKMKTLCRAADIITPNVTEACLLTDMPYGQRHSRQDVGELLEKLLELGVKTAIITGVRTDTAHMGVAAMGQDGALRLHITEHLPVTYHGTGDLYAATCVGALVRGLPVEEAIALAADYVMETIRVTAADADAPWYGVHFEQTLPQLMRRLGRLPAQEVLE